MTRAHVLSDEDFRHQRRVWIALGCMTGLTLAAAIIAGYWAMNPPRVFSGVPEIVKQTDTETVARIHTRQGERELDCILTIDHKRRAWSLSC